MNDFDTNIPPIDSFPEDNKFYMVWAYGPIFKSIIADINTPTVAILLREITSDNFISYNDYIVVKIAISELDVVRLMTRWKNKKRLKKTWSKFSNIWNNGYYENEVKYESNIRFNFNLSKNVPVSRKYQNKKNQYSDFFIPKNKYYLGYLEKNHFSYFINTRYTILKTNNNQNVYIPSLELFTSTYTPQNKDIRNKLIISNISTIMNNHIVDSKEENNEYTIKYKANYNITTAVFLAYISLNKISIKNLSILRNSLTQGSPNEYKNPQILPYHPDKLNIEADGIWIDENSFLVFRINNYSLPDSIAINKLTETNTNTEDIEKKDRSISKIDQEINKSTILPIDHKTNPHSMNGSVNIISEVGILNLSETIVTTITKEVNKVKKSSTPILENIEDIENLSSGSENSKNESKKTGKIKTEVNENKNHLSQPELIKNIFDALNYMLYNKVKFRPRRLNNTITSISFIDENLTEINTISNIIFDKLIAKSIKRDYYSWLYPSKSIIHEIKRRCFVIIKITFTNNAIVYLLEIVRTTKNDSFKGLFFTTNSIGTELLSNIAEDITRNKGVIKNDTFKSIDNYKVFKHTLVNKKIDNCLKSNIENILFLK